MKLVIFLLTFCVFQTVFANLKEQLNVLRRTTMKEIKAIILGLSGDLKTAIEDGRRRGLNANVEQCWNEFKTLASYYESANRKNAYNECYDRPFTLMLFEAFQYAEECYMEYISALREKELECRSEVKNCVQQHFDACTEITGERRPIAL